MITWNNAQQLVEVKLTKNKQTNKQTKKQGLKLGPNGQKLGLKLSFLLFSQVWFISFPLNCIG